MAGIIQQRMAAQDPAAQEAAEPSPEAVPEASPESAEYGGQPSPGGAAPAVDVGEMLQSAGPGSEPIHAQIERMQKSLDMNVPEARKNAYQRLIVAGSKYFYNPKSHDIIMQQLNTISGGSPANRMAQGVMAFLMTLSQNQEVKGKFPWEVTPLAGQWFLLELIDFMGKKSGSEPTREFISEATLDFQELIFEKLGITKEHVAQAQQVKQQYAPQKDGAEPLATPPRPAAQGIIQQGMA